MTSGKAKRHEGSGVLLSLSTIAHGLPGFNAPTTSLALRGIPCTCSQIARTLRDSSDSVPQLYVIHKQTRPRSPTEPMRCIEADDRRHQSY